MQSIKYPTIKQVEAKVNSIYLKRNKEADAVKNYLDKKGFYCYEISNQCTNKIENDIKEAYKNFFIEVSLKYNSREDNIKKIYYSILNSHHAIYQALYGSSFNDKKLSFKTSQSVYDLDRIMRYLNIDIRGYQDQAKNYQNGNTEYFLSEEDYEIVKSARFIELKEDKKMIQAITPAYLAKIREAKKTKYGNIYGIMREAYEAKYNQEVPNASVNFSNVERAINV